MPRPDPSTAPRADGSLTRRTTVGGLLALAATTMGAAAGCTTTGDDRAGATGTVSRVTRAPGTDPDVVLAATVLRDEQAMLDRVVATTRAHPRLAATLSGARAAHRAHVDLLAGAVPKDAPRSPAAAASASPPVRPSPHPVVPVHAAPALRALAHAEDRLSLVGQRSSLAAQSGAFARVLASMAAAAAQQQAHLSAAAQARR